METETGRDWERNGIGPSPRARAGYGRELGSGPLPGRGRSREKENVQVKEAQVVSENESIDDKVVDIVCKQLDVEKEKINPETSFINDLSADSLDIVELVMEFEEEFKIDIPEEQADKIRTVGDAVAYIKEHKS